MGDLGSEYRLDRLRQRDDIPFGVGDGEVGCVTGPLVAVHLQQSALPVQLLDESPNLSFAGQLVGSLIDATIRLCRLPVALTEGAISCQCDRFMPDIVVRRIDSARQQLFDELQSEQEIATAAG